MKKILLLSLNVVAVTAFIQCSEPAQDTQQQKSDEVQFRVDSLLIGEKISATEADYSVHIPRGWAKLSAELADSLSKTAIALFNADSSAGIVPTTKISGVATDTTTGSGFIAASYSLPDSTSARQFMEKMLQKQPDVQYATFTKKGVRLHQGLKASSNVVMFSILFETSCCKNTWQALHYIIPKSQYTAQTASNIETSIGTLSLTKQ